MSAEYPQYPQYPQYPSPQPQSPGGTDAPAPYPGTPGVVPGAQPGYPGYSGYAAAPGYPTAPYYPGPMPRKTNGMAIASLACSIASWVVIPIIGAIIGVIFGHLALGQLRRAGGAEEGRGLAIAGLAVGYVNLILWLLGALIFIILALIITATSGGGTSLLSVMTLRP